MFRQGYFLMTLKTTMLSLFIACFFFSCSSAAQVKCHSCYRTLLFHKEAHSPSDPDWQKLSACDNITSCCGAAEQNILPAPQISFKPPNGDIHIDKARGNYMDIGVKIRDIPVQELELSVVYPYNCSKPKTSCQGTEYFTQQMNLTIIIVDVSLEVLECDNCTHDDGHVYTLEGTLMKLKCSTNLNLTDAIEYWMEFHGGTDGSRVARCMPHIYTDTSHETGDPGWKVYRNSSTYECILEMPQCRMEDMGTYTCALLVPNDTNHYSKFYSAPKELNVMEVIPVNIITEPPATESVVKKLERHLYFGVTIGVIGTLILATVAIIIVLVTRHYGCWKRNQEEPQDQQGGGGYEQLVDEGVADARLQNPDYGYVLVNNGGNGVQYLDEENAPVDVGAQEEQHLLARAEVERENLQIDDDPGDQHEASQDSQVSRDEN